MPDTRRLFAIWTSEDGDVSVRDMTGENLSSEDWAWLMREPFVANLKAHDFGQQPGVVFIRGEIVVPKAVDIVQKWVVE